VEHELEVVHVQVDGRGGIEVGSPARAEDVLGGVGMLGVENVALCAKLFAAAALGFLLVALKGCLV
jgi:hypothetical protein